MENKEFWETLLLTGKLAGLTTLILFLISLPVAYLLAFKKFPFKAVVESIITLPLVLPPTVLGYYLLIAFSKNNFFGGFFIKYWDISLNFSFAGILIGSIIYSLPFMVHPLQAGFQNIHPTLIEASYMLGKGPLTTLWYIILPNIKNSIISGFVLTFSHTLGEFGVILMIGGNIKGETRVASIAVYDQVESMQYGNANYYALAMLVISFTILLAVYSFNKNMWTKKIL